MSIIDELKLQLQPTDYRETLDAAIQIINNSSGLLKIRGINDPSYLLLGTYLFVAQAVLEQFQQLTAMLALNLIEAKGTQELTEAPAKGTVVVELPVDAVASQVQLSSPSGITYVQSSVPVLVPANTPVSLEFTAVEPGSKTNSADIGNLIALGWFISLPATSVETTTGFTGGRNIETSESLVQRGLQALSVKTTPLSLTDWRLFIRETLLQLDNTLEPVSIIQNSYRVEQLPARPIGTPPNSLSCPNQVTRPLISCYVARRPYETANATDLLGLNTELEELRLVHTQVEFLPLPVVDVHAKTIIQLSTRPVAPNQLLDSIVAVFDAELKLTPEFLQHRRLLSTLSRLPGVDIAEDIWLWSSEQPEQPEPLQPTLPRADNLKLGTNLGNLAGLELVLLAPNYQQSLFYNRTVS